MTLHALLVATMLLGQAEPGVLWPLRCPHEDGVCSWQGGDRWSRVYSSKMVLRYDLTRGGRVVLLERGHQAPGRTVVLSAEGRVIATVNHSNTIPYEALWTETPSGDVVLCKAGTDSFSCDDLVGADGKTRAVRAMFPTWCLFPRFLEDETRVCVESDTGRLLHETGEGWTPVAGLTGLAHIEELVPWQRGVLVLGSERLTYSRLSSSATERIEASPTLWVHRQNNLVLVATHKEDRGRACFMVSELGDDYTLRPLWSSQVVVPEAVHPSDGDEVVLEASGRDCRLLGAITVGGMGGNGVVELWRSSHCPEGPIQSSAPCEE